jgi:hypothetical protein
VVRPAGKVRLAHQPQYPLAFDVLGIAVPDEDLDPQFVEDESIQLPESGVVWILEAGHPADASPYAPGHLWEIARAQA